MNDILAQGKFYLKPVLIIICINMLLLIFAGSYLESYEGAINSFIHGTYTKPCTNYIDINNHFLTMIIYEKITPYFPAIQVYGIAMYCLNFITLLLLGLILYRILTVNVQKYSMFFFILLYLLISADNLINLSSTRIALILIISALGFIESNRFENKRIRPLKWVLIYGTVLFACLIRFEATLIISIVYILYLILFNRFYKRSLIFFLISSFLFITFLVIINNFSSEAKQVFIFKEKEILDKNNFKSAGLDESLTLDLIAFIRYGILDEVHFTLSFYDKISNYDAYSDINYFKLYTKTLLHTFEESRSSWIYLFLFISTGIYAIYSIKHNKKRYRRYIVFITVFPLVVCLHSIVPLRFLVPYYSITACINILYIIKHNKYNSYLVALCISALIVSALNISKQRQNYLNTDAAFKATLKKLERIQKTQGSDVPVILNRIDYDKYFSVNPLLPVERQNVLFLNYFYHGAYDFYIDGWEEICDCNALSLKEKTDYIVESQNLFIIDDHTFEFMKIYFEKKFHTELAKTYIEKFDNELNVCKLNYINR